MFWPEPAGFRAAFSPVTGAEFPVAGAEEPVDDGLQGEALLPAASAKTM